MKNSNKILCLCLVSFYSLHAFASEEEACVIPSGIESALGINALVSVNSCSLIPHLKEEEFGKLGAVIAGGIQESYKRNNISHFSNITHDPKLITAPDNYTHCAKVISETEICIAEETSPLASINRSSIETLTSPMVVNSLLKSSLPTSSKDFGLGSRTLNYSEKERCECIESTLQIYSTLEKQVGGEDKIKVKMDKVVDNILSSYGKKFVNEYSLHHEDLIYFGNSFNFEQSATPSFCGNSEDFEKSIKRKCKGMSSKEISERHKKIFSSLDSGDRDLETIFHTLNFETSIREVKSKDGNDVLYSRLEYDKARRGTTSGRGYQFVDKMLTQFLTKDSQFQKLLKSTENKNGLELVSSHMAKLLKNDFEGTLTTLFGGKISDKTKEEWKKVKDTELGEQVIQGQIKGHLLNLAPAHPGLSALLFDKSMFLNVSDALKNDPSNTVMGVINTRYDILNKYMDNRCQNMIDDFSTVMCLPNKEILNGINANHISDFIEGIDDSDENVKISDYLSCRGAIGSEPALMRLNKEGSNIIDSDAYKFIYNKDKAQDGFTLFAKSVVQGGEDIGDISKAAAIGESLGSSGVGYDPIGKLGRTYKKGSYITSSGQVFEYNKIPVNPNIQFASSNDSIDNISKVMNRDFKNEQLSEGAEVGRGIASVGNDKLAPISEVSLPRPIQKFNFLNSHTVTEQQNIEEFKKASLSETSEGSEFVKSHMSNLTDKERLELEHFRKTALTEKESELEKQIISEKRDLDELKRKIEDFTSASSEITKETKKYAERADTKLQEREVAEYIPSSTRQNTSSDLRESSGGERLSESVARSSASVAGAPSVQSSASSSRRSSPSNGATPSSSISSPMTDSQSPTSDRTTLLVNDSQTVLTNTTEVKDRVVDYLKKSNPEDLLRFSKEGVQYRYKTLENGVVVDREIFVSMKDIDPDTFAEILEHSEKRIVELQRKYSFEVLKLIISEEVLANRT